VSDATAASSAAQPSQTASQEKINSAFEAILGRFQGVRRGQNGNYLALCPAHEDKKQSLSIKLANDTILLKCFAGCQTKAIVEAAKLTLKDLFLGPAKNGFAPRREVASYAYHDASGQLLYEVVRYEPKNFSVRRPNGAGGSFQNLCGVQPVIYNLPEVLAAETVYVFEGEKDCEQAREAGLVATCNAFGAGKWRPEFNEYFRGKRVVVIADADAPGLAHAKDVANSLAGSAASVKLIEAMPAAKDFAEWFEAGGTPQQFAELVNSTAELGETIFHTYQEFLTAPGLSFAIAGFVQNDAATVIGGLSEHGKTWILLSIAKALLQGKGSKLWDYFDVIETAEKVVYLIPESTLGPFGHRVKKMGLLEHVRSGRLLVRTLSKGPKLPLNDPSIVRAVKGAYVMLDTLVRFREGDENSPDDLLATNMFNLLAAGSRAPVAAHHSPKAFEQGNRMTKEAILRGTGDIGAMFAVGWGVKQLDRAQNVIHIENIKARDFDPCGPFQLTGRPSIDETGDFIMSKRPGECGSLEEEQPLRNKGGGASQDTRELMAAKAEFLRQWLTAEPGLSSKNLSDRFEAFGIKLGDSAVRRYRKKLGL
jgi:hypothetical protein